MGAGNARPGLPVQGDDLINPFMAQAEPQIRQAKAMTTANPSQLEVSPRISNNIKSFMCSRMAATEYFTGVSVIYEYENNITSRL